MAPRAEGMERKGEDMDSSSSREEGEEERRVRTLVMEVGVRRLDMVLLLVVAEGMEVQRRAVRVAEVGTMVGESEKVSVQEWNDTACSAFVGRDLKCSALVSLSLASAVRQKASKPYHTLQAHVGEKHTTRTTPDSPPVA